MTSARSAEPNGALVGSVTNATSQVTMRASTRVSQALVQAAQCLCGTGDRFPQIVWRASHHANRDPRRTAAAWEPIPNDALERFAEGKPRF